jgi:hypothetical protein
LLPSNVAAAGLNLEKVATGAEMRFVPSGFWQWSTGAEYSYRRFRNVVGVAAPAASFFTDSGGIALNAGVERSLVRLPERRLTVNSSAKGELGKFFALGRCGRLQGALDGQWFPKARGEDYEMRARLRGGKTFGDVPFDELFTLGFDRDTELWMRGHPGLLNGEKGNAPLGRNYVLANWEVDKIVYRGGFLTVKAGHLWIAGRRTIFWIAKMAMGYGNPGEDTRVGWVRGGGGMGEGFAVGEKFVVHDGGKRRKPCVVTREREPHVQRRRDCGER